MKQRRSAILQRQRTRTPRYEVRFKPPAIVLAADELLVPIVHSKERELRRLARRLDGSLFYVKAVHRTPESVDGAYLVMAKFKPFHLSRIEEE